MKYDMHPFTTLQLFLRPTAQEDKQLFIRLYTDPKVMHHIFQPLSPQQTIEVYNRTINQMDHFKNRRLSWTIIQKKSQLPIGIVALTWDLSKKDAASIGTMMLPNSQGHGYGTQAKGAMIEYGFNYLHLTRIYSQFARDNIINERVNRKLGFLIDSKEKEIIGVKEPLKAKSGHLEKQTWQQSYIESVQE